MVTVNAPVETNDIGGGDCGGDVAGNGGGEDDETTPTPSTADSSHPPDVGFTKVIGVRIGGGGVTQRCNPNKIFWGMYLFI